MKVKLKKTKKNRRNRKDWNILRRETNVRETYRENVAEYLQTPELEEKAFPGVEKNWKFIHQAVTQSAEEVVPIVRHGRRQP